MTTETNWQELAYTLFEEAGDALFLFDPETEQLHDVNPMSQRLSGYTRHQLLKMKVTYLFRAETPGGLNRLRHAFRRTGVFHSQEGFWLRHQQEGEWIPVNLTITRLHTEPRTYGLITARDIREQREAHAQLKKMEAELRRVTSSVSDCLWSAEVDSKGHWVYCYFSPVVEKITGRPPDHFLAGLDRWLSAVHPEDKHAVESTFARLRAGQSGYSEYRLLWPDGSVHWVRDSVMVTRGTNGAHLLLDGVLSDISERKQADEALRKSESRQRLLIEQMPAILWTTDTELRFTSSVGAGLAMLNVQPNGGAGTTLAEYFESDDPNYLPILAHRRALKGETGSYEFAWRERVWQTHLEPLIDADGRTIGVIGVAFDITDRKLAEEQLREREARLRLLIEQMPAIVWTTDTELHITSSAGAGLAVINERPNQFVGQHLFDVMGNQDPDYLPNSAHLRALQGESVGYDMDFKGRAFQTHIEPLRKADGSINGTIGVTLDVTERKRAEEALQESQRALVTLLSNLPGMAYRCRNDFNWTMEFVSEGAFELTGYAPADLIDSNKIAYSDLIHPDDRDLVWEEVQRAVGEDRSFRLLYRIQTATAEEKWVWEQGRAVVSADKQILALEGFITDITERKRADEAVRASEAKYRSLIENLTQSVFLKDRNFRFVAVNEQFCRSLGKTEAEVLGKTAQDLYSESTAEQFHNDDVQVLDAGRRVEREHTVLRNGKSRVIQIVKSPVMDDQGRIAAVLGISWDVTEQRSLEAQLRQAQKMDAIGQLAGGIAHDFNNLLTAVLGNLELVQAELAHDHPCHELLASAVKAGVRAAELTRQLLSFARQTPLRPGLLDLNTCIDETVRLLRRTIDPRISVHVKPEPNLGTIQADSAQMGQVIMNLCLNARDAMPDGGMLTVETANVVFSVAQAVAHLGGRPGEFTRLSISDTGHGMTTETREHLFEPFFTTKGPGKGTGLGLAMVFGIVRQHDGWIECQSELDKGTRFDVYLPRVSANPEPASSPIPSLPTGGKETILLADDHEMVCRLGKDTLERLGYRVFTASDGAEALELFRKRAAEIDLVILDLAMPKVSGQEVLRSLRKLSPDVCVLISSGNYTEQAVQAVQRDGAIGFVAKPYRPNELARCVRAALDSTKGRKPDVANWTI